MPVAAPSTRAAGRRGELAQGEPQTFLAPPPPASSAATLRSSKGSSRPPIDCVVSWPLPAMTTTMPAFASSMAARIASRRSTIFRYFVAPERASPSSTSRRIASGLFRARIVGRRDRDVGPAPGDLAHRRPLAAVPVAAAAEDENDLLVRELAHRREQPLEGVGGVGVVDEDRVGLPGLDPLQPSRARRGRR